MHLCPLADSTLGDNPSIGRQTEAGGWRRRTMGGRPADLAASGALPKTWARAELTGLDSLPQTSV
eukprot:6680976-Pyramimonas_sp.AAC.1